MKSRLLPPLTVRPMAVLFLRAAALLLCGWALPARAAVDLLDADPRTHRLSTETPPQNSAFTVGFDVANAGNTPAEEGEVTFYLSADSVPGNTGDVLLGTEKLPSIPSAGRASFSTSLTMAASGGPWRLLWVLAHPGESETRNNLVVYANTLTATAFDLEDTGAANRSLSTTSPSPGQSFQVTAKVRNLGPTAAPGYNAEFRLSADSTIGDADDVILGTRTMAGLGAPSGALVQLQEVGRTLSIPENQAPGTYRFGYRILAPGDANQANNTVLFGASLTVPAPPSGSVDLVDAGSSHWGSHPVPVFLQGANVRLSGAIRNLGTLSSAAFSLVFYASSDDIAGDADDVILSSMPLSALSPFVPNFSLRSFEALVPTTQLQTGVGYRFGWIIIGGNDGNTENNRTLTSAALLSLPPPAIEFTGNWNVTGDRVAYNNALFIFAGSLRNNRNTDQAVRLATEFRREGDTEPVWETNLNLTNAPWIHNQDVIHFNVPANGYLDISTQIKRLYLQKRPTTTFAINRYLPAGTYQVTMRVYDGETDALLDSHVIPQLTPASAASRPDLNIYSHSDTSSISPQAVQPGGTVTVSNISVSNRGVEDSPPTLLRFYANDTPIGTNLVVPAINRANYSDFILISDDVDYEQLPDATLTIPASVGTGEIQIYAVVDPNDDVDEDAEYNNRAHIGTITVGFHSDLTDAGAAHRVIPEAVLPGVPANLSVRVRNQGLGASGTFATNFHLFPTRGATEADIPGAPVLGTVNSASLTFLQTRDLPLLFTVPSGTATGTYYVGWKVDAGGTATEISEANNFHLSNSPLHVGPAVNLKPGGTPFALSAAEVTQGGTLTLTGSRANTGSAAAGTHRCWIVLSADDVITSGDFVLVNTLHSESATPAGSDFPLSLPLTVSANLQPGVYHVGYLFDPMNQVGELSEIDNIVMLPDPLQVIPPAQPGVPPPAPEIVEFEVTKRDVFLSWTSRKGLAYEIESSENGRRWEISGAATGAPGLTGFVLPDIVGGRPRQFFRVRVVPP